VHLQHTNWKASSENAGFVHTHMHKKDSEMWGSFAWRSSGAAFMSSGASFVFAKQHNSN